LASVFAERSILIASGKTFWDQKRPNKKKSIRQVFSDRMHRRTALY
jgi:hypothetical protein